MAPKLSPEQKVQFEELKKMIRAFALPHKQGITLGRLNHDYKDLEGRDIPFEAMGFESLPKMLTYMRDVVTWSVTDDGRTVVNAVATNETKHIAEMVAGQSVRKRRNRGKNNHRKPTGLSHSFNAGGRPSRPSTDQRLHQVTHGRRSMPGMFASPGVTGRGRGRGNGRAGQGRVLQNLTNQQQNLIATSVATQVKDGGTFDWSTPSDMIAPNKKEYTNKVTPGCSSNK